MIPCRYVLFALFVLLPSIAMAESYICVSEMVTGFVFDQKLEQWKTSELQVIELILSRQDATTHVWNVKFAGNFIGVCIDPFTTPIDHNCLGVEIKLNKNTLRFVAALPVRGFEDGGRMSPLLAIGHCALL